MLTVKTGHIGLALFGMVGVRATSTQLPSSRSLDSVAYAVLVLNQPARLASFLAHSVICASPLTARTSSTSTFRPGSPPLPFFVHVSGFIGFDRVDIRSDMRHS